VLAIVDGWLMPVTAAPIEHGTLLIEDGKIVALGGPKLTVPPGSEVIEASEQVVLPGFIDAHTHAGLIPNEWGAAEPCSPQARIIDGIDPADPAFREALMGGVTTLFIIPGSSSLIGGQGAVLKVVGGTVEEMLLREPAGIKMAWGATVKSTWTKRNMMPTTRMAMAATLREEMQRAKEYKERSNNEAGDRDLHLEALADLLTKRYPARVHCYRVHDIMTVIGIAEEFDFDLVLEHATDAHLLAAELARHNVPVVLGPWPHLRDYSECPVVTFRAPGILSRAGVKVAFMSDYPVVPIWSLPIAAAIAVREGMEQEEALKALTISAAQILGVGKRIGSLETGKDADVVIWSRHPFEWQARVEVVIVNGKVVHRYDQVDGRK